MMGEKEPTGKLFYVFDLEQHVPAHHLLRRVAEAVDFSFVPRLTARFHSHTGQPSVDPIVLVKMALLGYLYCITSGRRLVEEIALNLAYRWFLGYELDEAIPDYSVLSKARARFGPTVYLGFFTEIIRQCERAGLVRGNLLYADSTLIQADSDVNRTGSRALLRQLPYVSAHLEQVWTENDPPASDVGDLSPEAASAVRLVAPTERPSPARATSPDGPLSPLPAIAATLGTPPSSPAPTAPSQPTEGLHLAGPGDPPNRSTARMYERMVSRTDPDAEIVT